MRGMRVLITGGAGYIGSHVVLDALNSGCEVTIFDNLSTSNRVNINPNAKFIKGDISSNKDLLRLFKNNNFEAVIHLAGLKCARESMIYPQKYALNNIIGSLNLLNKCVDYHIKYFIFSSSAAVYGNPEYIPVDELHPLNPINYYGFSKLSFENNLKWISSSNGISYASLRYFNAAGYDSQKRIFGSEIYAQNLIPIVMETALGKRPFVSIFGSNYMTKDGTGIRDYIHVNDLAEAHIKSLKYISEKNKNLIINLGSEKGYSVIDIIKTARKITENDIQYKIENPRPGEVAELVASCSIAKSLIGWEQIDSNLEKIIKSTWAVYQKQG